MKQFYIIISTLYFLGAGSALGQLDSVQKLDEVMLKDVKLTTYSQGYKLQTISDTLIDKNQSLTDVLRFNTSIYFKENGYGMVSSPSFRGTNASQTAVIWNGIPINSALTGQTDFNTIAPQGFDQIIVRSGGGSVLNGSGAVGGSIYLTNDMKFKKQRQSDLTLGYGSYESVRGNFKSVTSSKTSYFDASAGLISSENDYDYIATDQKNENGAFKRFHAGLNFGIKLKHHVLSWNSAYFYGDRNFPNSLTAISNDKYQDVNSRNLIQWKVKNSSFTSTMKIAYLLERYRYFANRERHEFDQGKTNTFVGDYFLEYTALDHINLSLDINYTRIDGSGDAIGSNSRNTMAAAFLAQHQVTKKFGYGLNFRQEFLNDFDNPFLYSVDALLQLKTWYALKINVSRNFRIPTFNDLYWNAGGNPDLQPESSYQGELGNVFRFGKLQIDVTAFYIDSKNLIQWRPNGSGVWSPENVSEAKNYGAESSIQYENSFGKNRISLQANYAYTKAINSEKKKQQIYVPFHKATALIRYGYENFSLYAQSIYNGKVFSTTDNLGIVDAYSIANLGLELQISQKTNPITFGIKANNIFNTYYENVAYRPMPDRNFETYLNFKF